MLLLKVFFLCFLGQKEILNLTMWPPLEPVCCKKQQEKVPDQLLVCGIGEL
jgi:hypothetical protein